MLPVPIIRTFKLIVIAQVLSVLAEIIDSTAGPIGPGSTDKKVFKSESSSSARAHKQHTKIFPNKHFFKQIRIPRGSSMSLTAQVSRPKLLPESFTVNENAIIVDGVIELPMWMDLDRFVEAMYMVNQVSVTPAPAPAADAEARKNGDDDIASIIGKERCFLYEKLESLISSVLLIPHQTAAKCLQRAICEVHEIATYYPTYAPSLGFELIQLFLSPSYGSPNLECYKPYVGAESLGKLRQCDGFKTKCSLNISALLVKHFVNQDDFMFENVEK